MAGQVVELEIPARAEFVSLARLLVSAMASSDTLLPDERIDDLKIAVSEACTNAIEAHGAIDTAERDADARERLNEQDDELDDLHVSLTAEISSGKLSIPVVIEMALIARFYERLGDHAVNVAGQVRYLATGDT